MLLVLYLKTLCLAQGHMDISPILSPRRFIDVFFTFTYTCMIDLELIFYNI